MHRLLLPAIVALLLAGGASPGGDKTDPKKIRIRAGFTDTRQVGFMLLDSEGKAHRITNDPLGGTNVVAIRIDNKNYAFGFEGGVFVGKPQKLDNERVGEKVTWKVDKIEVTQSVETVLSKTGQLDACLVTYAVVNQDDKPHTVGVRVGLDTLIESNDGNSFRLPDSDKIIQTQADFKGDKVPAVVLALENADLKKPGLVATLTLKVGGALPPPDRVSLTHFPDRDSAFGWELAMKDIGGDAYVGIYWNPVEFKPGASRTVGYAYGGGVVTK
jgi:hypothetical protein